MARRMAKSVPLTQNLWEALTTLSGPTQKLPLLAWIWIDAVCIDQLSDAEKSSQILLMNDIYGRADNVNVWLSRDTTDVESFLWMHDTVYPALNAAVVRLGFGQSTDEQYAWMNRASPLDPLFWSKETSINISGYEWSQKWKAYRAFYGRRNWFKRSWVVQEVMLAKAFTVTCGEFTLDWPQMMHFYSDIYNAGWYHTLHQDLDPDGQQSALSTIIDFSSVNAIFRYETLEGSTYMRNIAQFHGAHSDIQWWTLLLEPFIRSARNRRCTFPEDKVNSLLGLLQRFLPAESSRLLDSKPEIGAVEAYTWIASLALQNAFTLFFLNCKEDKSALSIQGLPSWVPDFCAEFWPTPINHVVEIDATFTKRAEHSLPLAIGNTLHVQGALIGTILSYAVVEGTEGDRYFAPCLEFILDLADVYEFTGQDRMEVLWRTLIGDSCGVTVEVHPAPSEMGACFKHFVLMELSGRLKGYHDVDDIAEDFVNVFPTVISNAEDAHIVDMIDQLRTTPVSQDLTPSSWEIQDLLAEASPDRNTYAKMSAEVVRQANLYRVEFQEKYMNRRLFSTEEGHLGLGPLSLDAGDEIFLLEGGRTPYVLRKRYDGSGKWEFLGDCYIHGVMHGEMMTEEFKRRFETVRII
ncbi:hypothetical protein EJ08DRAFT_698008 [Tothia fuscella]|uniref:Heterokaryon incompatibility domain-containing protein n=1 Tax=Tothia fuscella TaxID=1048955 RepID=A0A9P4NQC4_9PEZI|nr:hypothetical protein EJ08DRAFT_698008 [Tothia fuscella]